MECPRLVEMDMFHCLRGIVRLGRAMHGVSHHKQLQRQNLLIETSWANEICERDSEERAITIAAMNEIAYLLQIWLPLIVWQQVDAPRYFKGYVTVSVMSVALIGMSMVVRHLHNRERSSDSSAVVQSHQGPGVDSCAQLQQSHSSQNQSDEKDEENKGHDFEMAKPGAFVSMLSPVSSSSDSTTTTLPPKEYRQHQKEVVSPTDSVDIEMEARPSRIV